MSLLSAEHETLRSVSVPIQSLPVKTKDFHRVNAYFHFYWHGLLTLFQAIYFPLKDAWVFYEMTFWKALWCNKLAQLWSLSLVSTKAFLGAHSCEWHRRENLIDPILFPMRMYHRKIHTHYLEKKREKRMQAVNLLHWIPISYQIKFNFLSMSFRDFHSVSLDYLSSLCSSNLLDVSPTPSKPDYS